MSSSPSPRRSRLAGALAVTVATAVLAGTAGPLGGRSAAAAPLPAPPVVGPADAGPVLKEVVLDWTAVPGASSYVVQVGTDDEWSDEPTLELTTVASRLTLPTSLPHGSYVWRVAAVGADGQGRWSAGGTFTRGWDAAPRPLGPVGPVDPAAGVPTFSWTPVPTASEYQLQVSNSPFFDSPFREQGDVKTESCFTTRTSVTPFNGQASARNDGAGDCTFTMLGTGAALHWRVRPLDHVVDEAPEVDTTPVVDEGLSSQPPAKGGELDTSPCPAPPKPISTSAPVGGGRRATPTASPSGSASPSDPAPDPSASASASPSPGDAEQGSCEPAHEVEKGAWSAASTFFHVFGLNSPAPWFRDLPAPDRPTASTDVCRESLCRDFPTVSWNPVPGAQWYRLSVALDASYTNLHAVVETPAQTWTPTDQWRDSTAGAGYHVVVQPCTIEPTTDGRRAGCGAPSAPLVFRKSSPRTVPLLPAHAAAVGGSEVVLSWQPFSTSLSAATGAPATSEAHAYRVQVSPASSPGFGEDSLVADAVVDGTHHVSADKRYRDGDYLWRVQAIDASGHRQPWSPVRRFTRDSTPPTFIVGSAGKLPARGPIILSFSEPVLGIDARSTSVRGVLASVAVAPDRRTARLSPGRPLLPGASHTVTVTSQVRDRAGNPVAARPVTVPVDPVVDDRSGALALTGSWKRLAATNAVARTWSRGQPAPGRPTTATVVLHGRTAQVKGCVGPALGTSEIWVDGRRAARVDGYRSYSGCGVVLARLTFARVGPHTVQVRSTGAKRPASRGTAVGLDAITAGR